MAHLGRIFGCALVFILLLSTTVHDSRPDVRDRYVQQMQQRLRLDDTQALRLKRILSGSGATIEMRRNDIRGLLTADQRLEYEKMTRPR